MAADIQRDNVANEKEGIASSIIERRGIYYQAFDIYEGISGFYDYGGIGLRIKRNIEREWRSLFVNKLGAMEIETSAVTPEIVLRASGHLDTFTDPIVRCGTCRTAYRADKLMEEFYAERGDDRALAAVKKLTRKELAARLKEENVSCEKCRGKLLDMEDFNLMFKTQIGHKSEDRAYLRPETAQGIFVGFRRLAKTYGLRIPAVICQAGKAYRNEISPRQQLVRMREFTQMESEVFFDSAAEQRSLGIFEIGPLLETAINFVGSGENIARRERLADLLETGSIPNRYFALFLYMERAFLESIGIDESLYRFRALEKEELPHYSKGNVDLEIKTAYGYIEVAGNAYRTDYDLSQHSKFSGKEIKISENGREFIPHVVESSIGLDRLLLSLLDNSAQQGDERGWCWLRLSEAAAPYRYALFPLQKDEKLLLKSREMYKLLVEKGMPVYYLETGSIGKRYAKSDEIGIPSAITCDYQTLEDDTVTVRSRDTTKQERRPISSIL